jgi:predicted site-specific integrase-resolvase
MDLSFLIPPDAPEKLRASHLARYLGVAPTTIRNWAREGLLPRSLWVGPKSSLFVTEQVRRALADPERQKKFKRTLGKRACQ